MRHLKFWIVEGVIVREWLAGFLLLVLLPVNGVAGSFWFDGGIGAVGTDFDGHGDAAYHIGFGYPVGSIALWQLPSEQLMQCFAGALMLIGRYQIIPERHASQLAESVTTKLFTGTVKAHNPATAIQHHYQYF